jgi:tetratricopeptide (TPR) repeat protein
MSPEQIRAADVGPKSDIFAVGSVLYEVLTCMEAFPGKVHQAMHKILYEEPKPLSMVLPQVDPGLVAILAHALQKDAVNRYPDLTVMRNELALVRQRLERQGDVGAETVAMPSPAPSRSAGSAAAQAAPPVNPGAHPGSGPGSAPGSRPGSAGSHRVSGGSAHRLTLERKRAAQIEVHLLEARKYSDAGAFDKARDAVEQALMFDPDHPTALQLADEIAAEEERHQVAQFVASARLELQQGRFEAAERILVQAIELAPQSAEVLQLREAVETTRREIERARQVQDMLRRARTRFSEGSFEGTIRAVGELLAIDPNNAAARDLQARAQEAIDTKAHRAERDAAAQAAVTEARALFEKGDKESAITMLEAFTPPHDLVSGFLASLRGEQVAEALQEPAIAKAAVASSVASGFLTPEALAKGVSRKIEEPPKSHTPIYVGLALAAVVVVGVGWYMSTKTGGSEAPPQNTATTAATSPAPAPAPAPVIPPPAVVTPPASLTAQPPQSQDDRDAMAAYKLLSAGQHVEASKIVAQIARRNPTNENLKDLRAQIQTVADTERQRAAAAAVPVAVAPPVAVAEKPAAPVPGNPPSPVPEAPADKPPAAAAAIAPPPAVSPGEVERPAIEASIHEYAKALSSRDLPAVARVRRYTPAEARNWENIFKQFAEYRLIVKVTGNPTVHADGDRATVPVEETFAQTAKKGGIQVFSQPRKTEYKLEKIAGKWMLLPPG